MKVRATAHGFFAGKRWRKGEVFDIPDDMKLGGWMEDASSPPAPEPDPDPSPRRSERFVDLMNKPADNPEATPETMAEMTRGQPPGA